jgi:hypothetical protein
MDGKTQSGQALVELVFGLTLVIVFFLMAFVVTQTTESAQRTYRFKNERKVRL